MPSVTGALMGVVEVKLPLKRMPLEERCKVANASHWAVVNKGTKMEEAKNKHQDICERFIGEVDEHYSMREVEVRVEEESCKICQGKDVVLHHRIKDVIIVVPVETAPLRMVYITRSESFGRAAVVLMMKNQDDTERLKAFFPHAVPPQYVNVAASPLLPSSSELQVSPVKDKASWGRGMGKMFAAVVANLAVNTTATSSTARSPRPTRKDITHISPPADPCDPDSSSDDDELSSDDIDSKSTGKYYEGMGLDSKVQERLYDNDSLSRSSDSFSESSVSVIEAELKFFVETDREFLKSLRSLSEDREKLSSQETPHFIREKVLLLFVQVKSLTSLHEELHEQFESCGQNLQCLSNVITSRQAAYDKYVYFMENIPVVDNILADYKDYFKTHMPELPEKLRKPRMRLHYYVLTLETLRKRCSQEADKAALQKAIDILKVPLKKADSKLLLSAVKESPFDLTNFGILIRHSDLTLRKGGELPRRVYHVLLLKTLVLLTISRGRYYQYVASFRMDEVGMEEQERGLYFNIKVRGGPRGQALVYVFKAKNINVQQQWINDLKEILQTFSQPTSARNSYIEGDSESRVSGKRVRGSRNNGNFYETSKSFSTFSDSDLMDDTTQEELADNDSSRSHRRGAIKKSSTNSSRSAPILRQQSGYSSDGESYSRMRTSDSFPSLTIWATLPELKHVYPVQTTNATLNDEHGNLGDMKNSEDKSLATDEYGDLGEMKTDEKDYIREITEILGDVIDPACPRPPQRLVMHMRHLHEFHDKIFLPLLDKAVTSGEESEVGQCFLDCSEKFIELYSQYFADYTRIFEWLHDDFLLERYKAPADHLVRYTKYLRTLQREKELVIPEVHHALTMITKCTHEANAILLTETIKGAPFNLQDQGPVIMEGKARVRWTGLVVRQDLYVVLLESMILLLEPRQSLYYYVNALRMDTVGIGPTIDVSSFQLEVRTAATKTVSYVFRTNRKSKKEWEIEITKLLHLQVEKLKERQKRRLGNEQAERHSVLSREDKNLHNIVTGTRSIDPSGRGSASPVPRRKEASSLSHAHSRLKIEENVSTASAGNASGTPQTSNKHDTTEHGTAPRLNFTQLLETDL